MAHTAVAVGDNCIDNYLYPIRGSFVGGNALNVAVTMRRCGIRSSYVGAVGTDENGVRIMSALRAEGVDVSKVQVLPGSTAVTDVEIRDGERVFAREELGVLKDFRLDASVIEFIASHELVHNTYLGQTERYLPRFRMANVTVSFDYSDMQDQTLLANTLPFVDIAFVSTPNGSISEAEKLAKELTRYGPRLVVATMGAAGSLAFDGNRSWFQPAIPVDPVVDTLGAGDAFIGTFLSGWLEGKAIDLILREAAARASDVCRHLGAWVPN